MKAQQEADYLHSAPNTLDTIREPKLTHPSLTDLTWSPCPGQQLLKKSPKEGKDQKAQLWEQFTDKGGPQRRKQGNTQQKYKAKVSSNPKKKELQMRIAEISSVSNLREQDHKGACSNLVSLNEAENYLWTRLEEWFGCFSVACSVHTVTFWPLPTPCSTPPCLLQYWCSSLLLQRLYIYFFFTGCHKPFWVPHVNKDLLFGLDYREGKCTRSSAENPLWPAVSLKGSTWFSERLVWSSGTLLGWGRVSGGTAVCVIWGIKHQGHKHCWRHCT